MLSSGSEKYMGKCYARLVPLRQSGFMYVILTVLFQEKYGQQWQNRRPSITTKNMYYLHAIWLHVSTWRGHFPVIQNTKNWMGGRNYNVRQNAIFRTLLQLEPYNPIFLLNVSFPTIYALYLNPSLIFVITWYVLLICNFIFQNHHPFST